MTVAAIALLVAFQIPAKTKASPPQATRAAVVYLERGSGGWCAYVGKRQWSEQVARETSAEVAEIHFKEGRIVAVQYTLAAESGDWIVFDDYAISRDGSPSALSREVHFAQGGRSYRAAYSITRGVSRLAHLVTIDPATGKAVPVAGRPWLPPVAIVTRAADFPFSRLLRNPGLRSRPVTCAGGR